MPARARGVWGKRATAELPSSAWFGLSDDAPRTRPAWATNRVPVGFAAAFAHQRRRVTTSSSLRRPGATGRWLPPGRVQSTTPERSALTTSPTSPPGDRCPGPRRRHRSVGGRRGRPPPTSKAPRATSTTSPTGARRATPPEHPRRRPPRGGAGRRSGADRRPAELPLLDAGSWFGAEFAGGVDRALSSGCTRSG